jgi:hypothetical protein
VPLVAGFLVRGTGNMYAGLWFPIAVAGLSGLVGLAFVRETQSIRIWAELGQPRRTPTGSTARV